jgi:hypothetical protein
VIDGLQLTSLGHALREHRSDIGRQYMTTRDDVLAALAALPAPGGAGSLSASGALSEIVIHQSKVYFSIAIDPARAKDAEALRKAAEDAVRAMPGVAGAMVTLTAEKPRGAAAPAPPQPGPRAQAATAQAGPPGVSHIIAVASGKGGVGKSTTACNLALGFAASGLRVGVVEELMGEGIEPGVRAAIEASLRTMEDLGATVVPISLPTSLSGLATYYVLAPAECSSTLARLDGIRYGPSVDADKLLDQYAAIVRPTWSIGDYVDKPRAWRLPMSSTKRHGPGWVAVGDAAGFVNPMNGEGIDYALESGMLAVEQYLADPAQAPANYDRLVGQRFDAFLRTGRRFSFLIGHPWLLRPGLRIAVGTQTTADITLAVMGNLIDSSTPGAAGRVMRVADTTLRWADPVLRRTRAAA